LEYCFLYLKLDTILLSEAFLKFRNLLIDEVNLDACQFLSTPHLSFHLMLKVTKVNLEYHSDSEAVDFLTQAIRGGHSYVNVRHAEQEVDRKLGYFDMNNLYGVAMSTKLPTDEYRWLSRKQIAAIDWSTIDTENDTGYILEVDLEYPKYLHKKHDSFILAPEKKTINYSDLSPYSQGMYKCCSSFLCSLCQR
jgi:hypothetical protein